MLKIYCQDCGAPTSYSNLKPKFCSSCGKPFDKNIVVNKVHLQKPTITEKPTIKASRDNDLEEDLDQDGIESVDYVPNISRIEFEISDVKPSKVKMKDIIGNSLNIESEKEESTKNKKKLNKNLPKKYKPKNPELMKQFRSEAGTLRPSAKIRKNLDG